MEFEWDDNKNTENRDKHGVSFFDAQSAFYDSQRVIAVDIKHSTKNEKRYFCFGKIDDDIFNCSVYYTIQ